MIECLKGLAILQFDNGDQENEKDKTSEKERDRPVPAPAGRVDGMVAGGEHDQKRTGQFRFAIRCALSIASTAMALKRAKR